MIDAVQMRDAEQRGRLLTILRQMTYRFGEVPAGIAAKLQSLGADALDDLSIALFGFNSYVDVEQWLATAGAREGALADGDLEQGRIEDWPTSPSELTMLTSMSVLEHVWGGPEEDEAWRDL